ncbi:hypothetical protein An15g03250 [Aspergillus niger]|uniref:Uncharacterized protein n=2 Tax=Aspergillus niger TaxID=5061 RepID=A2R5A5_ASPNC|nr:hypothetical protein An15g03250 [Aspergillus niger]CAK42400.1 hypothetical protein An15g03250 [Aspergillus niger]
MHGLLLFNTWCMEESTGLYLPSQPDMQASRYLQTSTHVNLLFLFLSCSLVILDHALVRSQVCSDIPHRRSLISRRV